MTYQAAMRNATNTLVTNQAVGLQISILQGTVNGNSVFVEQQFVSTNTNGLVTIQIGTGWNSPVSLFGPQGTPGANGPQGPPGPVGPLGSGFTHYLGEIFGGGVIFHLWKDKLGIEHGLIVDLQNLAVGVPWANNINTSIGAPAKSLWDGENNSNAIIAASWHTSSAAALCINSTNSGYSDWYLPSIDELKLLRENSFSIDKSFSSIPGASPLTIPNNYTYWSSTETIPLHALSMYYLNSVIVASNKSTNFAVRAIRSF